MTRRVKGGALGIATPSIEVPGEDTWTAASWFQTAVTKRNMMQQSKESMNGTSGIS